MEMVLVPCYSDRELFLGLAKNYVEELGKYDTRIVWEESFWNGLMWSARFVVEGRKIQGFVVTEEISYKVYNDLLYIAEMYIVPEERKRGVGIEAVKKVVEHWNGDVFLYILEHNFKAKAFWMEVEKRLGWERIERPEVRKETGCELCVYSLK